ncbi:MAG: non-canonical purine NTP pyrophosphatase [Gemmatimonadota bacterium]|nr:non-canonical purine NTP pyrophosphatase [Gemmatimonadota bacterium]
MPADRPQILLATRSSGKLRELSEILRDFDLDVIDVEAAGIPLSADEDAIESFPTFEENALAKARYFHAQSGGMPTLADDSGVVVDALGGAPGVISKRFSGRGDLSGTALDAANNAKLMAELSRVDAERLARGDGAAPRTARYVCVAAFVSSSGELLRDGKIEGRIIENPRGAGGFGYDPHFESAELEGTFAEADWSLKSRVSHRGRAFRALLPALRERGWA